MPNKWEYTSTEIKKSVAAFGKISYKWDGNSVKDPIEVINKLGDMGWELVSALRAHDPYEGMGETLAFYFKRPKLN